MGFYIKIAPDIEKSYKKCPQDIENVEKYWFFIKINYFLLKKFEDTFFHRK